MHRLRIRSAALACLLLAGCARFKPLPADHFVFVTAKQAFLRDRVAAVSNRTGQVENGDKLKVLDRARHWVKVQTAKSEVGWIEEKVVATEEQSAAFDKLKAAHKDDPDVASAVVRDQVYMHIAPGRDTDHFYLLNEGEKLKLLRRATLEKAVTGATVARAQRAIPQAPGTNAVKKDANGGPIAAASVASAIARGRAGVAQDKDAIAPPPPAMEDWWLARDAAGHTGWLYARMVDVDAPDALTRYGEGQKFVGAYVLTTVRDDDAPGDVKDIPIYVAVLAPYKAGLPYDFDQIRVFTWSVKHHRYETAFREKNIEGYLPVTVSRMKDPSERSIFAQQALPSFTVRVLSADAPPVIPNPVTGEMTPGKTITQTFRLEETTLHRLGSPAASAEQPAHPILEDKKNKKKAQKR